MQDGNSFLVLESCFVPEKLYKLTEGCVASELITVLDLRDTGLYDEHMHYLSKLFHLQVLDISFTLVSDVGLAQLIRPILFSKHQNQNHENGLYRLNSLNLDKTCISSKSLVKLSQLPQLKWLNLSRTKITKKQVCDSLIKHGWRIQLHDKDVQVVYNDKRPSAQSFMIKKNINRDSIYNYVWSWITDLDIPTSPCQLSHLPPLSASDAVKPCLLLQRILRTESPDQMPKEEPSHQKSIKRHRFERIALSPLKEDNPSLRDALLRL